MMMPEMENLNLVEKGFLRRWSNQTLVLFRRAPAVNLAAILILAILLFAVPQWGVMAKIVAYLALAVLLALARYLDVGTPIRAGITRLLIPAMGIALLDVLIGAGLKFMFSGTSTVIAFKTGADPFFYDTVWQQLHGYALIALNVFSATAYPKLLLQNLPYATLIYLGASRGRMPSMSLSYLMTAMMAVLAMIRNLAPAGLLLIAGEFVLRSESVVGEALLLHPGGMVLLISALGLGAFTWVASLWSYFYLREVVDGRQQLGLGPEPVNQMTPSPA